MTRPDLENLEQSARLAGSIDAFGDLVTKGQRNVLDLPAFYDFSEERYRFVENGTRIQNPDADSTRFSDQDQQFLSNRKRATHSNSRLPKRPATLWGMMPT